MLPHLQSLPDVLIQSLGRTSCQEYLVRTLQTEASFTDHLRRHGDGEPYAVRIAQGGLDVVLQCVNPNAEEIQWQWGLHSFSLHTPHSESAYFWKGSWMDGIDPAQATRHDIADLLTPHGEVVLESPVLTCFTVFGLEDQRWSLLFRFDPESGKLLTLSVIKTGEWIPASVLPPWPKARLINAVQS